MSAYESLNAAADLLEKDGWCQYAYAKGGKRCAAEAIQDAATSIEDQDAATIALNQHLNLIEVHNGWEIEDWNDTPGRTVEQVVAAMRAAAAIAQARTNTAKVPVS